MSSLGIPEQPRIPGYEPVRPLGINLGVVYVARHSSSGKLVALKIWPVTFAEHALEIHGPTARLRHPNIIHTYEMGEFEGNYFCAIEWVERSLAERLQEGCLPDVEAARVAYAIGSALQYARAQGMAADSLSPPRICLADHQVPKLTRFCAIESFEKPVLTKGAQIPVNLLRSPALMPPEWLSGAGGGGEPSEVYRLGALMYEMLTARPPFRADSAVDVVKQVFNEMPERPRNVNPRVGRKLDAICMKCLEKQPTARYTSLQDLLDHLEPLAST